MPSGELNSHLSCVSVPVISLACQLDEQQVWLVTGKFYGSCCVSFKTTSQVSSIFPCQWVTGGPLIEMHDHLPSWLVHLSEGLATFEDHLSSAEKSEASAKLYPFSLQLLRTQVANSGIHRSQVVNRNN